MWSVVSLVRQGLRWGRRRTTTRVVDESALGAEDVGGGGGAALGGAVAAPSVAGALARALMALACTISFEGEDGGGVMEEAWAASGWRPRADEVSHLMVRESMRYAIYA